MKKERKLFTDFFLSFKVAITSLTKKEAIQTVKIAFSAASERDIYTGDAVEIFVIEEESLSKEILPLRKD